VPTSGLRCSPYRRTAALLGQNAARSHHFSTACEILGRFLRGQAYSAAALVETLLGFDFGLKRIGVAVGNSLLRQAQPLTIISAATNDAKFAAIAELIAQWQPQRCIVGLPLHPDGAEHEMTVRCRRFANQLHGRFGVAPVLVDERYSSAVLQQARGEHVDDRSAAIILQQYFDSASS
jgi:putative Holliday junction resolvase